MSKDYTAIRVSTDAKKEAAEVKRDGETWDDYIRRCTENPPEVREFVDADVGDVSEQLERIERSAQTAETRTGRIESTLEDLR